MMILKETEFLYCGQFWSCDTVIRVRPAGIDPSPLPIRSCGWREGFPRPGTAERPFVLSETAWLTPGRGRPGTSGAQCIFEVSHEGQDGYQGRWQIAEP